MDDLGIPLFLETPILIHEFLCVRNVMTLIGVDFCGFLPSSALMIKYM